ncbi:MAG: Gfo/Idh/MocA family oxidoreductase [Anaerolineae bacterium]
MTKPLKIGLVGAGQMMQLAHLPHLRQIADAQPVAIADIDLAAAQRVAAAYNIPRLYHSSEALLAGEPELDGVIVVTPRMQHATACLPILAAGIPVFMEKPLEVTPEKGREIVAACQQGGTFMVIGYNNRYDPAYLAAQALLHSGELGDIRYARIHSFGGLWRAGAHTLGEISLETAPQPPGSLPQAERREGKTYPAELEWVEGWIHEVNMARGLFGEARAVRYVSNDLPRLALVEFERTRAFFEVGLMLPPGCPFDCAIAVHCQEGRLDLSIPAPLLFRQPTELKITTPQGVRVPSLAYQESFVEELVHFCRCLRGYEQPRTTAEDALRDLELCFKIVEAGREKQNESQHSS